MVNDIEKFQFDEDQKIEIQIGVESGLDVSSYANPEFMAIQMRQIRMGLQDCLDVSAYADPKFDWFQMEEIRYGIMEGLNYALYAKPEIGYEKMRVIRKGLQENIDLSNFIQLSAGILEELRKAIKSKVSIVDYIKEGYKVEQLEQIRIALENRVDIRPHINLSFRGASIREIALGLEEGLPVSVYANMDYGWQQMREIRLGMEKRLDINQYSNCLFSWQQMREIRLGLEEGIDVEAYRKFIYMPSDMEAIRKRLVNEEAERIVTGNLPVIADDDIFIFISNDEMEACVQVAPHLGEELTGYHILERLRKSGVCQGIIQEEIDDLIEKRKYGETIVVAKGKVPQKGEDGWYEFFFNTNPKKAPVILPDGSVDFSEGNCFELVTEGQKLAFYHSAGFGVAGHTVTGKFLKARRGREQSILAGNGFQLEEDGKTYVSKMNGRVTLTGGKILEVSRVCVLENVNLATGNFSFDGSIYVKGNIGSGSSIYATENIVVDGYVEAAKIKCDGEIILRQGMNGNGTGYVEAGGNVIGQFFEDVRVATRGDIYAHYCMNCQLDADGMVKLYGHKGLLLGGVTRAAKGITAYSIGNKMGIKTALYVGITPAVEKEMQRIATDIESVNHEISILRNSYDDFRRKYAPEIRNTMDIYLKIENAIYTKELQMKDLEAQNMEIEDRMEDMRGASVVVGGILYEGTDITVDNVSWKAFTVRDVTIRCKNRRIVVEST